MPPISVTIFASDPGTYFLEDDGIPGNNFSRIRFPDGTTVAFEHPTDDLFFDPSVAGITLVINLVDSLGTSRFSTGVFADPLSTPDFIQVKNIVTAAGVTLIANDAITEFTADPGADITASTLVLSATTGVGTAPNALETQVGVIEAETNTGGINLRNFGTVSIGGLTGEVDGLDVVTSGNVNFTAFGSIVLSDELGPETVHGGATSGNVALTADGVDSDILANIDQDSVSAPFGNITLAAGRDIGFGLIGTNFDNDVRANGTITFNPGRDLLLDGFADVVSDAFGNATGGDVIANAGRNVTLLAVAGTDAGIEAGGTGGGDIILNTGPGGTVTLNSGNGTAPFASLISQTGDIIINADRLSIGTNGAISTVAPGSQTIINPFTEGWEVDVGSASDAAFALEISDAEIDRIFTPTLSIGDFESGALNVTSAISPLNALSLLLRSGTDIGISASMTVGGSLTLRAGDNLFQLPASAINIGGQFNAFVDELGDDGGVGGFGILNGSLTATFVKLEGNAEKDTLNGTGGANTLLGNAGADTLSGFGGDDMLDGGLGQDTMNGGTGDDVFIVDNAADVAVESVAEGDDRVQSSVSRVLESNIERLTLTGAANLNGTGNDLVNVIFGNSGDNLLNGGVGADIMAGGLGDDTFVVDNIGDVASELAAQGTELVNASATFTLGANVENLTLTGLDAINGTGNGAVNIINGNGADNVLDGGGAADVMTGGLGNDTYVVDVAGDDLNEAAAEGTDTVESTVGFTLAANFENLTLIGVAAVNGTGNGVVNILTGNNAANTLNGLAGADTMIGQDGNDIYVVDTAADDVEEAVGEGNDLVQTTVTLTLSANVERLTLLGASAINGTGNSLANILNGNSAANILNGGTGVDTMAGDDGDDTYVVDNNADDINENPASGTDQVNSSVNYTLGSNLENLTITGGAAASGTGNLGANVITGNGNINTLNGGGGTDTLIGLGGNDIYIIDDASDTVVEALAAGTDVVRTTITYTLVANVENLTMLGVAVIDGTGNSLDNTLTGNAVANILNGGTGEDTMIGGLGSDTYIVDNNADVVIENAAGGIADQVNSSVNFTLDSNAENLTLTGVAAASGTGNGVANVINGNGNINTLKGEGGIDTIDGGGGNDNIYGGTGDDVLTGAAGDDKFVFDTALNAATNVDDILDYVVADDTILLDRAIFTGIAANGTLAATAFRAGLVAVDADDRILYDAATGTIRYDSDGVGGTAAILFATVDPGLALTNADFTAFI